MSNQPYTVIKRKIPHSIEKTCGIMLEEISEDDKYTFCKVCRKNFFSDAMIKWLISRRTEDKRTCPNCRQQWGEYIEYINVDGGYIYSTTELENNSDATFVLFYANWCSNLDELKAEFIELEGKFVNAPVQIKMFDFSKGGMEAVFEYCLVGFPTIRYYPNGTEYQTQYSEFDPKVTPDLTDFLVKQLKIDL